MRRREKTFFLFHLIKYDAVVTQDPYNASKALSRKPLPPKMT